MLHEIYHGPRPIREIRAVFDDETIWVYQAFSREIALPALEKQTFVPPFAFVLSWASWIKPSFLWTMKRTNWGRNMRIGNKGTSENEGNAIVLAVDVRRVFFDDVLASAQSTHYPRGYNNKEWGALMKKSIAYVQWDPEKTLFGEKRSWKAIQIGLKTPVLREYAASISRITDMSNDIHEINALVDRDARISCLPDERPYPLIADTALKLGIT